MSNHCSLTKWEEKQGRRLEVVMTFNVLIEKKNYVQQTTTII